MNNELLMQRCLELAQKGLGRVKTNPLVGALLVYNDKIIGEGYHEVYGEAHAEVNAIANVKKEHQKLIKDAILYVNLEPCCHHGKTPPCVDLILQHQIKKVVVANVDPNPLVAGQGIEKLRSKGVDVINGVLEKNGKELNKRFFVNFLKKRPFILLKWAESQDGFIATEDRKRTKISADYTKYLVHQWRSEEMAIMVGTNTAQYDNPKLNVRYWAGHNPMRILIDKSCRIDLHNNIFNKEFGDTIVYTAQKMIPDKTNVIAVQIDFDEHLLTNILKDLYKKGIASVLIEGGKQLLESFLKQGLWDEARVIKSKLELQKGIKAPRIENGILSNQYKLLSDQITIYRPA